ncbi:hypothetical protein ACFWRW_06370, partial [Streptomyces rubiginosohelvolus]
MNTTPAKTTNPDDTAAAQDAATKDTETKDAPGTSSGGGADPPAPGHLNKQPAGGPPEGGIAGADQ